MMTTGALGAEPGGAAGAAGVPPGGPVASAEATEDARRRRFRRTVRALMVQRGYTQKELGDRAGLSKSGVGRLLSGERDPRAATLEKLAAALGVTAGALLDTPDVEMSTLSTPGAPGTAGPLPGGVHSAHPGARGYGAGPGGGQGAQPTEAGFGGEAGVWAVVYPGFVLWGRSDPRAAGGPVGEEPRRVMRERASGLGGPGDVFVVLVEDDGLAEIETASGRVRAGWRLFVDRRTAGEARPGAIVAGWGATGRLFVGALEQRPGGAWALFTGAHREAVARADVLGEVVEYQPPPAAIGHIRGTAAGAGGAEGTFFVGGGSGLPAAKAG